MTLARMIPPRVRRFGDRTVGIVTKTSRTSRWRHRKSKGGRFPNPHPDGGYTGEAVVDYMQSCCVEADLPPLAEQDILDALVAVEEAIAAGDAANQKDAA